MKVTILDSGSAYGTPMIFNTWRQCKSLNQYNWRTRPSIFLEIDGKHILIDAGPDLRYQINKNNISNIDAVFLTHGHYDHIGGIPELPRASQLLEHNIDIFASQETLNEIKKCYNYLFKPKTETSALNLQWHTLPDIGKFNALGLEFDTFQVNHHNLHPSAFRYHNFAYVTDWDGLPAESLEHLYGLDLLIIECNNGLSLEKNGHSNLEDVKKLVNIVKPQQVVLSHLSARVDYDDTSPHLPDGFSLSHDGMILSI